MKITKQERLFFHDLNQLDDIGLVTRGQLYIENELVQLITHVLPYHERCHWERISYRGIVELALACGLPIDLRTSLEALGTLRDRFVQNLETGIDQKYVLELYTSLPSRVKEALKSAYVALGRGVANDSSRLEPRDLFILVLLNVRQAARAEAAAIRKKRIL